MNQHLNNLGLTDTATLEEIKSSYRALAKKYHPDLNKDGLERFKSIKASYEWLLKNHVPSKPIRSATGYVPYYEILGSSQTSVTIEVYSASSVLETGIVVYLMKGMQEYRAFVEKGTQLPKKLELTNVQVLGTPVTLYIKQK